MQKLLIPAERSVIVSVDSPLQGFAEQLVYDMKNVPNIGGFKLGFEVGIDACTNRAIRGVFNKKTVLIYDHQKAGNDIPEMGLKFARKVKEAGFDATILFPFAGPKTQRAWTEACQEARLHVLVGGIMTHPEFLVSEGGYIADDTPERIFALACEQGVRDFVVPGTKLQWVKCLRALLVEKLGEGNFVLYAPGFLSQGGDITECGKEAGASFHAIVGRDIYGQATSEERVVAALQITSQIAA